MLSKSRGQVLRIATILHMLFSIDSEHQSLDSEVSETAVKAAVNFVQTACQQTAFIAGKGHIQEEVQAYKTGMLYSHYGTTIISTTLCKTEWISICYQYHSCVYYSWFMYVNTINLSSVGFDEGTTASKEDETAGFCLTLPGRTLYLTPLLALKKFRKKGNKDGAVRAFYQLMEEGLGNVLEIAGTKGTSSVSR